MELLVDRVANLTGRPVRVGSAEAAALGNAIVQGISIGSFASLAEGRSKIVSVPNVETPNVETSE